MYKRQDNQVAMLQSQIKALEDENKELLKKISEASVEAAAVYRQQYNCLLYTSALYSYLQSRKIDADIGRMFCKEIHYELRDRHYFARCV